MEAGLRVPDDVDSDSQRLHLWLEFYPPDRRPRDDDNMVASFKAGRDGIAQAMGINDKRFICHPMVMDQIGGFIKARVTAYMEVQKNEG
jgi:crossover junction endodeoxyribonuclease RusA